MAVMLLASRCGYHITDTSGCSSGPMRPLGRALLPKRTQDAYGNWTRQESKNFDGLKEGSNVRVKMIDILSLVRWELLR